MLVLLLHWVAVVSWACISLSICGSSNVSRCTWCFFTRANLMLAVASILLFEMFRVFHRPKTFHQPPYTLYRSWIPDPARTHYGSIRLTLQRNYVWLPSNTDCYHSHQRICKSIGPHSVDTQFWSSGTILKHMKRNDLMPNQIELDWRKIDKIHGQYTSQIK